MQDAMWIFDNQMPEDRWDFREDAVELGPRACSWFMDGMAWGEGPNLPGRCRFGELTDFLFGVVEDKNMLTLMNTSHFFMILRCDSVPRYSTLEYGWRRDNIALFRLFV